MTPFPHWSEIPARIPNCHLLPGSTALVKVEAEGRKGGTTLTSAVEPYHRNGNSRQYQFSTVQHQKEMVFTEVFVRQNCSASCSAKIQTNFSQEIPFRFC